MHIMLTLRLVDDKEPYDDARETNPCTFIQQQTKRGRRTPSFDRMGRRNVFVGWVKQQLAVATDVYNWIDRSLCLARPHGLLDIFPQRLPPVCICVHANDGQSAGAVSGVSLPVAGHKIDCH